MTWTLRVCPVCGRAEIVQHPRHGNHRTCAGGGRGLNTPFHVPIATETIQVERSGTQS